MYPRFLFFLLVISSTHSFVLAQAPEQMPAKQAPLLQELDAEIAENRNSVEQEKKILDRNLSQLDEAKTTLEVTEKQLTQAKSDAQDGSVDARGDLQLASIRYSRHQNKVTRYEARVLTNKQQIETLESKLEELLSQRRQIETKLQGAALRNSAPRSNKPSLREQKPSRVKSGQNIKANVDQTVRADGANTQTDAKDLAKGRWPYLSTASEDEKAFAVQHLQRLKKLKANNNLDKAPLNKVELSARLSFGTAEMDYFGDSLYGLLRPVKAGRQHFQIFNQEYWHTIPVADDNALYRFIFDMSSASQPKLYLFKEALLH